MIAETETPQEPPFVDDVGPGRETYTYRVATHDAGRRSSWSKSASALPTFVGMPLAGWINVTDYDTCTIAGITEPHPIQCALQDLGGRTDNFKSAIGPRHRGKNRGMVRNLTCSEVTGLALHISYYRTLVRFFSL